VFTRHGGGRPACSRTRTSWPARVRLYALDHLRRPWRRIPRRGRALLDASTSTLAIAGADRPHAYAQPQDPRIWPPIASCSCVRRGAWVDLTSRRPLPGYRGFAIYGEAFSEIRGLIRPAAPILLNGGAEDTESERGGLRALADERKAGGDGVGSRWSPEAGCRSGRDEG